MNVLLPLQVTNGRLAYSPNPSMTIDAFIELLLSTPCGGCMKVCPKGAIHIELGIIAKVNKDACIGCGKCARECPAGIILIAEREVTR